MITMSPPSRPTHCYLVLATEFSRFHPDPEDPEECIPLSKKTNVENVVYGRELANILAKEYFIRQHCESMSDSNENEFGGPSPRAAKWGIWVPEATTKSDIREIDGLCRIEVVIGTGWDRTEFLVEVVEESIPDADGPLARGS